MNRDRKLEKLVKTHGLFSPSPDFTDNVIGIIKGESIATSFRPLIGKRGRLMGIAIISLIIILTFFGSGADLSEPLINIPQWDLKLPDISFTIPRVMFAGIVAVFLLVLSDAGLRRKRT